MPRVALNEVPKENTITATYEIVTPMFLGDADQKPSAVKDKTYCGLASSLFFRLIPMHQSSMLTFNNV